MPSANNDEVQAMRYLTYVVREFLKGGADRNSIRSALASVEKAQRDMTRTGFHGAARPARPK